MQMNAREREVVVPKPAYFVGRARDELRELPEDVRDVFGKSASDIEMEEVQVTAGSDNLFADLGVAECR